MSESRPQAVCVSRFLFILIAPLLLPGCDQQALFDRLIPKKEAEFARSHLALYRSGNVDAVLAQLYPRIVNDETRKSVEELMAFFPDAPKMLGRFGSSASNWSENRSPFRAVAIGRKHRPGC